MRKPVEELKTKDMVCRLGGFILALLPTLAHASLLQQSPVDISRLRIVWVTDDDENIDNQSYRNACQSFGNVLKKPGTPWKNLFPSYGCYAGSDLLSGISGPSKWTFQLQVQENQLTASILYSAAEQAHKVGEFTTPAAAKTVDLLADGDAALLLLTAMFDTMPFLGSLSADQSLSFDLPVATENAWPLYELAFNTTSHLWVAKIVGTLNKDAGDNTSPPRWTPKLNREVRKSTLFFHSPAGPAKLTNALLKKFAERNLRYLAKVSPIESYEIRDLVDVAKNLVAPLASGFVGLRVGHELTQAQSNTLPPMTLYGLFSEFYTFPINGLRLYYDIVPANQASIGGETIYLGWTKAIAGWALGLELGTFLSKIEIVPKFNVWNVKARLPIRQADDSVQFFDYRLHNTKSIGLELNGEIRMGGTILRPVALKDFAVGPLNSPILTTRFGADAMFGYPMTLFGLRWHAVFLIFLYQEQITIQTHSVDDNPSGDDFLQLALNPTLAGAGFSVAW